MSLLSVLNLEKRYGPDPVLSGVGFRIERGERVALVGANGSGKSTLLRIIAGLEDYDAGKVALARNAIVNYVPQHARFHSGHTLWEVMLEVFAESIQAAGQMRALEDRLAQEQNAALETEYRRLSAVAENAGYDYESRIERVLTGLELHRSKWREPVDRLSGGQRTRVNLARALLREGDLLLLDEPTNHLDIGALEWLETFLRSRRHAFIVVAHDRYFLERVTARTLELSEHRIADYPASYMGFLRLRSERRRVHERQYQRQQEQITATEEFIRRYAAGQRSKEARGRQKRLDRLERLSRPAQEAALRLKLDNKVGRGADIVARLEHLSVGFQGRRLVELPDELVIARGARVAIVGPNGSGKTTIARTLVGRLPPVQGSVHWSPGQSPAYYAQSAAGVFPEGSSVLTAFEDRHPVGDEMARTYLGAFLFAGDDVHKPVDQLSGGERSRLALACLLYGRPNVLVLDEPSNHLDIAAREVLGSALESFTGTLLLISHDRFLIDQLATEVWSIPPADPDAVRQMEIYDGNWSDFVGRRYPRHMSSSSSDRHVRKTSGARTPKRRTPSGQDARHPLTPSKGEGTITGAKPHKGISSASTPSRVAEEAVPGALSRSIDLSPAQKRCSQEMGRLQEDLGSVVRDLGELAAIGPADRIAASVDRYEELERKLALTVKRLLGESRRDLRGQPD